MRRSPATGIYQIFTDAETVEANRRGEVTAGQRAELERSTRVNMSAWIWLILTVVLGGAILLLTLKPLGRFGGGQSDPALDVCGTLLALLGVFSLTLAVIAPIANRLRAALIAAALRQGTVAQAEGEVVFTMRGYQATAGNGQWLQTFAGFTVALPPGRYRFYYLPQPPILLSAEPLSE